MHGGGIGNIKKIKVGARPRRLNIEISIVQERLRQSGNIVGHILNIRKWCFGNIEIKKTPIINIEDASIGDQINTKKPAGKGNQNTN